MFVVNPIAGGRNKADTVESIKSWAQSSKIDIEVYETCGDSDKRKIEETVANVQPTAVVAVGGDGTVTMCAEILLNKDIALGIIPMGSANGMATELEIPTNLQQALDIIEEGYAIDLDSLCFNDKNHGIHISDIGLNARLVKEFEKSESRGFLGYTSGLIEHFNNAQPFEAEITTDGKTRKVKALMIAFANAKRYGTGALLNSAGKLNDGLMEVCILYQLNLTVLAGHFINLVDEQSEHIEVIQCREALVKTFDKQEFQIDGEMMVHTDQLKVKVRPQSLRVIVPSA